MLGRIAITQLCPVVACGRWPARAVAGEIVTVAATVIREGHDALGVNVEVSGPQGQVRDVARMQLVGPHEPDRWVAAVPLDTQGCWSFVVEAWGDPLSTWRHDAAIKVPIGQDVELVLEEGARLYSRAAQDVPTTAREPLERAVTALREEALEPNGRLALALAPELTTLLDAHPVRELLTRSQRREIWVDRPRALVGAWYEFFPRSEGASLDPPRSGTLATAAQRLPAIAEMGFDVVYLPPVHPIGAAYRKGSNNTLEPAPGDPGSPWAIGSADGGHDAIHPDLGTMADFDAFVARAGELGMELALDFALQASPDHPWASAHPEWFSTRADGSIAYAENPPKKYQDIYPINFDNDPPGIYAESLRVLRHWMSHGVRIFRVDNPHTKPVNFWEWLIAEVKRTDPDVLFLAEAFTRPPMMHLLAQLGFTQSYTYFTWRTEKWEIEEYLRELAGEAADYMRPNFFVNTPDILHAYLQFGGPPAFKIRAVLASLLSPSWGVYSGYELFEHTALRSGSEEYLNSEKYQYRPRDWAAAERAGASLAPYLRMLNGFRRAHPALHRLRNLTFHNVDHPDVMAWSKSLGVGPAAPTLAAADAAAYTDTVLVVVNLDPHAAREATVHLDLAALGLSPGERISVSDEVTGASYDWGEHNYVRLDPFVEPAHVFSVHRAAR